MIFQLMFLRSALDLRDIVREMLSHINIDTTQIRAIKFPGFVGFCYLPEG
jgi:hypothetical protein